MAFPQLKLLYFNIKGEPRQSPPTCPVLSDLLPQLVRSLLASRFTSVECRSRTCALRASSGRR